MFLVIVGGVILAIVAVLGYGALHWQRTTAELSGRLAPAGGERGGDSVDVYREEELAGLPSPVQRYFRTVLNDGRPIIRGVSLKQKGSFNMGRDGDQWKPFTATQEVNPRQPGFLWDARIRMLPVMPVHVHDAYVGGEGILHAALFGLVTVTEMRGTPAAAEGELLRYLAEAPWYPTALLPSQGAEWEEVASGDPEADAAEQTAARVTIRDGETAASVLVRFNDEGLIASVYADARGREVDGEMVPTPWEGRWWNYQDRDGMRVPTEGEVAWLLEDRRKPYWRGRVTSLRYEFGG
jgi:hypothetical protein